MSDEKCNLTIPYAWLGPIAKLIGLLIVAASGGGISHYFGADLRREQAAWDSKMIFTILEKLDDIQERLSAKSP